MSAMLWEYIGRVFAFAFKRTTPTIDSLQIVAASAVPAVAKLLGVKVASGVTNDVLAYIGAIAVAFIMLRLISAPYFLWREQVGEIGTLRLELSRPERLELEHMTKVRARSRLKFATAIRRMQHLYFVGEGAGRDSERLSNNAVKLHAEVNPSLAFTKVYSAFYSDLIQLEDKGVSADINDMSDAEEHGFTATLALALSDWLHGKADDAKLMTIYAEALEEKSDALAK